MSFSSSLPSYVRFRLARSFTLQLSSVFDKARGNPVICAMPLPDSSSFSISPLSTIYDLRSTAAAAGGEGVKNCLLALAICKWKIEEEASSISSDLAAVGSHLSSPLANSASKVDLLAEKRMLRSYGKISGKCPERVFLPGQAGAIMDSDRASGRRPLSSTFSFASC